MDCLWVSSATHGLWYLHPTFPFIAAVWTYFASLAAVTLIYIYKLQEAIVVFLFILKYLHQTLIKFPLFTISMFPNY